MNKNAKNRDRPLFQINRDKTGTDLENLKKSPRFVPSFTAKTHN